MANQSNPAGESDAFDSIQTTTVNSTANPLLAPLPSGKVVQNVPLTGNSDLASSRHTNATSTLSTTQTSTPLASDGNTLAEIHFYGEIHLGTFSPHPAPNFKVVTRVNPAASLRATGSILPQVYLLNLLSDVDRLFQEQRCKNHVNFLLHIIAQVIEKYFGVWDSKAFVSRGHRDHGDDWLRWRIASRLIYLLVAEHQKSGKVGRWIPEVGSASFVLVEYWRPLEKNFGRAKQAAMRDGGATENGYDADVESELNSDCN